MLETAAKSIPKFTRHLDAKGLNCPLPILKTKVLLNVMQPGEVLFIEATDAHSQVDFAAYCARSLHELLYASEISGVHSFYIRCVANPQPI